jgi:cystathionine beta-lyase/cystathionine gamma-synthase
VACSATLIQFLPHGDLILHREPIYEGTDFLLKQLYIGGHSDVIAGCNVGLLSHLLRRAVDNKKRRSVTLRRFLLH